MLFNSFEFIIYFPIVVIIYRLLPKIVKPVWLLAASYYFYMCWNVKYAVLIVFTTLVTYAAGLIIDKVKNKSGQRAVLIGGIGVNLLVLFLFKYFNFFLNNCNGILGLFGHAPISSPFHFLLPVGISFYTFQAIGYVVDVYRGDTKAEKNIINYALFVSFFPQLVAGPIERSKNLLSQIKDMSKKNLMTYEGMVAGFGTMLWGLFLKMVIADRASIAVDKVFDNYHSYGTVELVLAAILFSIQIYADFAGYSAVAIGAAKVIGVRLCENFNTPYFAENITDFWARWHISLSTWFKDYVYIPLGGNRKGKVRKYVNLLITFILSGLWHGAAWNFLAWGLLHGIYRVIEEITRPAKEWACDKLQIKKDVFSFTFTKMCINFVLVAFAWIFFRAESIKDAFGYIARIFTNFNPWNLFNESIFTLGLDRREFTVLFAAIILVIVISVLKYKKNVEIGIFLEKQNLWFRWAAFIALAIVILVYGKYGMEFDSAKFIYFDF